MKGDDATATRALRVLIAGGGTGGHVFPAIAIAQAIRERRPDAEIVFVGTKAGVECRAVPHAGFNLRIIWISGFARHRLWKNLTLPVKLLVSLWQCLRILRTFKPHIVIGTGGYAMGPVLLMAQKLGYPTILQEQNSLPGVTTRKLAGTAQVVCVGFADAISRLRNARTEHTGNPVRREFRLLDRGAARSAWPLASSRQTLLVFGGSLGARSVNEAIAAALPELLGEFNLIWQTGRSGVPSSVDREALHTARTAAHLIVLDFIDDMPSAYVAADLAVCRAGAMTLAELALAGLPAILIPYPHAADDHQTLNAQSVVAAGAAVQIADSDLSGSRLATEIRALVRDQARLRAMSTAMRQLGKPNAADDIAAIALRLARPS